MIQALGTELGSGLAAGREGNCFGSRTAPSGKLSQKAKEMAGADVPRKKIPDDLEVIAGWKEEQSGGANCFYFTNTAHPDCMGKVGDVVSPFR